MCLLHFVRACVRVCFVCRIKEFVFWRRFLWRLRKSLRKTYEKERAVAVSAVVSASRVAQSVYQKLVAADVATKGDKSPVTIADLAAQAIVLAELAKAFPNDAVVAEETSAPLSEDTDASRLVSVSRARTTQSLDARPLTHRAARCAPRSSAW